MDIFKYQNDGLIFIYGDFNSRCGSLHNYISGVDILPERNTVDFRFFINTNLCILYGRTSVRNEFTSISVKGCSVVDCCITPDDSLNHFTDFTVTRTTDLINKADALSVLALSSIPDHSLLSWNIVFNEFVDVTLDENVKSGSFGKFDVRNALFQVNNVINKLEQSQRTQTDMDSIYEDWCHVIKQHMYSTVPYTTITVGIRNKKRRPGKPWWSHNLSNKWSEMCKARLFFET